MKNKVFKVTGKILMDFLNFGLIRINFPLFLLMLLIFSGCQDEKFYQNDKLVFDNQWENVPFNNTSKIEGLPGNINKVGVLHNSLMSLYADNFDDLFDLENRIVKVTLDEFLEFNYEHSLVLLDRLGIDMCFSKEDYIFLSKEIIRSQADNPPLFLSPKELLDQLKSDFPELTYFLEDFQEKVFEPIIDKDPGQRTEILTIVETESQKIKMEVLDSRLNDSYKAAMLSFLDVFESSLEQILTEFYQYEHPFYELYFGENAKSLNWGAIALIDAGGAIKGASKGFVGGWGGSLLLGFGYAALNSLSAAGIEVIGSAIMDFIGW